ncbi:MAG TPA: arylesterase [Opitutaceae bacterium]|nr:arylesterase [Opitutaceae bacterium]
MIVHRLWFFLCSMTLGFAAIQMRAAQRTLVFFGDSLTAGHGLDDPANESFPALIQKKITAEGLDWRVVNAGLSGETSAAGLRRVDWILRQPADVFVLALGANDGLRGIAPTVTEANLQGIIDRVRAKYPETKIVVAGMMMPESMGAEYTQAFRAMYPALAKKNSATVVPFLLEGVGGIAAMNHADRIHPNPRGHAVIAETMWKYLRPLL